MGFGITVRFESLVYNPKPVPYFADYKTHLGFRGGKRGGKKPRSTATHPQPGRLHSDYEMHPHFPPKFG